ncbi:MAG: SRPBCC family protein [Chloroflexales bacterium]|nr:SRPBCC family protein [Chloroflexales bacterium]
MFVQEQFISINTTPDVVERHLTDPALLAQWRSPLLNVENQQGIPMALGSKYTARPLTPFFSTSADYTVTERDSGHILQSIDGMWIGKDLWRWWTDGPRTVVQNRVEYEVPNLALSVFVGGLIRPFAELDMGIQLIRLRSLIEGPSSARQLETRTPTRIVVEE